MSSPNTSEPIAKFSLPQYKYIESIELLDRYRPGGYHPAVVGDDLHDRYTIIDKLGYGGYSTIWLARDHVKNTYVAIKIGVAEPELKEADILRKLHEMGSGHEPRRAASLVPYVLDDFTLKGPNGVHRCLVTALASTSVKESKEASTWGCFQPSVSRAIIAQLVVAVDFLHRNGMVHADLHLGNVLLQPPENIDHITPAQYYEEFGKLELATVERIDGQPLPKGVPSHAVYSTWFGERSDLLPLSKAQVLLTDFGESFFPHLTPRYGSHTPDSLLPPEVYFLPQEPLSFPADIWALSLAIWEILGGCGPFGTWPPVPRDWWVRERLKFLGPLPTEWLTEGTPATQWWQENGDKVEYNFIKAWEERFDCTVQKYLRKTHKTEIGEDEKSALFTLLRSMLAWKPDERPTAAQVLDSEWMRIWVLPDLEKMDELLKQSTVEEKVVEGEKVEENTCEEKKVGRMAVGGNVVDEKAVEERTADECADKEEAAGEKVEEKVEEKVDLKVLTFEVH